MYVSMHNYMRYVYIQCINGSYTHTYTYTYVHTSVYICTHLKVARVAFIKVSRSVFSTSFSRIKCFIAFHITTCVGTDIRYAYYICI